MLVSLLGALALGLVGLFLDRPKVLAGASAGGSLPALVFLSAAC